MRAILSACRGRDIPGISTGARRQPPGGQRIHSFVGQSGYVEVREDLGGDLVRNCGLDRWIPCQRRHGCDITIGIGDQVL